MSAEMSFNPWKIGSQEPELRRHPLPATHRDNLLPNDFVIRILRDRRDERNRVARIERAQGLRGVLLRLIHFRRLTHSE